MRNTVLNLLLLPAICCPSVFAGDVSTPARHSSGTGAPELKNVVLSDGGTLAGQVINADGRPVRADRIKLVTGNNIIEFSSDETGRFRVSGLRTGACLFEVGNHSFACRVWTSQQAPPRSIESIALVADGEVVRGQDYCPPEKKRRLGRLTSEQKYGLFILGLFGAAGYLALSRDNAAS